MKLKAMLVLAGLLGATFARAADEAVDTTVYVESDGSQYIDLGYPLSSDMEVEIVATIIAKKPTMYRGLFGARKEADEKNFSAAVDSNDQLGFILDCNDEKGECLTYRADVVCSKGADLSFGTPYRIVIGAQSRSVVGQPRSNSTPIKTSFTTDGNACVFAINGVPAWGKAAAKVHLVRIRQNGAILHEYLPDCKDGVYGLSDAAGDGGFKTSAVGNPLTGVVAVNPDPVDPDGHRDSIVSDGTQVIDLGFKFTSDMTIRLLIAPTKDGYTKSEGLLGARATNFTTDGHAIEAFFGTGTSSCYCDFVEKGPSYNNGRLVADVNRDKPTWIVLSKDLLSVQEDASQPFSKQPQAQTSAFFETPCNAWLFGLNMPTLQPETWAYAAVRFYELTVTQDGVVTHQFLPAVENGVVGIRDFVGNGGFRSPKTDGGFDPNPLEFFGTGSGPFLVALKPSAPYVLGPGLRQLDYIESNGSQYIDTRVSMDGSMSVEVDFMPTELPESGTVGVFGARNGAGSRNISSLVNSGKVIADYNNNGYESTRLEFSAAEGFQANARYAMELTPSYRAFKDAEGQALKKKFASSADSSWTTPGNLYIFKINDATLTHSCAKMRLYRLRIARSDGSVVRDFIPCLDSNDKPGLYDCVTGDVRYQEAGDDFAYGGVVSASGDVPHLRAQTTVNVASMGSTNLPITVTATLTSRVSGGNAYIESDHTQFIDLGFKLSSETVIDLDFMPVDAAKSGTYALEGYFGARTSSTDRNIEVIHDNASISIDLNYNATETSQFRTSYGSLASARYLAHIESGNVSLTHLESGLVCASSKVEAAPFETEQNAHLFDSGAGGSFTFGKMRFYSLKVSSRDGRVLHWIVPDFDEDGRVGVRDLVPAAEGGCGFLCPTNSGANPLKYVHVSGNRTSPHQVTEQVRFTEPGEKVLMIRPLKFGAEYEYTIVASNGVSPQVSFQGRIATEPDVKGDGESLEVLLPEEAPRPGQLTVCLARPTAGMPAANVTAYFGRTYGGIDPAKWEKSAPVGVFPDGEQFYTVTVKLPKDFVYVRFKTSDGLWSPTVFRNETQYAPSKAGLAIILR